MSNYRGFCRLAQVMKWLRHIILGLYAGQELTIIRADDEWETFDSDPPGVAPGRDGDTAKIRWKRRYDSLSPVSCRPRTWSDRQENTETMWERIDGYNRDVFMFGRYCEAIHRRGKPVPKHDVFHRRKLLSRSYSESTIIIPVVPTIPRFNE